jgi:hypothetical protein
MAASGRLKCPQRPSGIATNTPQTRNGG